MKKSIELTVDEKIATEKNATGSEQADGQAVVADGGVEYEDYNIDPSELEFDIENSWYDSTNSLSNMMCRIKGTELWVCFRSWQTGPSEFDYAIKGLGEFRVEGVELDYDFMIEQIREVAEEVGNIDDYNDFAEELKAQAPELAEEVAEDWASGVEELVVDAAYDGYLNHDGTFAWVSHVTEAYHHETQHAINEVGIEDTSDGVAYDAVRSALSAAVDKHCSAWRNPHAEYIGRLKFEVEPWELRALELHQKGVFRGMIETARVQALRETGMRPSDISDVLNVNPSTVTRHKNRADEWLDRAKWTVENVTEP